MTGRVARGLPKRRTFRHKPHVYFLAITRTYCFHKRDAAGITTRVRITAPARVDGLREHCHRGQRDRPLPIGFTPEAFSALVRYDWPGNVRELENAIECTLAVSDGPRIEVDVRREPNPYPPMRTISPTVRSSTSPSTGHPVNTGSSSCANLKETSPKQPNAPALNVRACTDCSNVTEFARTSLKIATQPLQNCDFRGQV
jgi:hypothetical protein